MGIADTLSVLKSHPDRLYKTSETAALLGKSVTWAERHRWAGTGPQYLKVGRTPYYKGSDLLAFFKGSGDAGVKGD